MAMRRKKLAAMQRAKADAGGTVDALLEQGSHGAYEAMQLMRSKCTRALAQGEPRAAATEAAAGARELFARGHASSAHEMATLCVDACSAAMAASDGGAARAAAYEELLALALN